MALERTIQPSDFGPSFVFELPIGLLNRERFEKVYIDSFNKYNSRLQAEPLEHFKGIWESFKEYGIMIANLQNDIFDILDSNALRLEIEKIPIKSPDIILRKTFNFISNEERYDYLIIRTWKNNTYQKFLSTEPRRLAFHDILKKWINIFTPHFVWGDWFTILKKEGEIDSRLNVWGYNYYSQRLVEAIGMDRFNALIKSGNDWVIEEFNNGLILTGNPDPYSKKKAPRNKAKKILRLDECLKGIINIKPTPYISTKETKLKGDIK